MHHVIHDQERKQSVEMDKEMDQMDFKLNMIKVKNSNGKVYNMREEREKIQERYGNYKKEILLVIDKSR